MILPDVKECLVAGCHYQTNVKGDMTRHRKDKHSQCPGCNGPAGQGPGGCCKPCWRDKPRPNRPISDK